MRAIVNAAIGSAWTAMAVFFALQLAGCANGVVMSEAETIACRNSGCTAWTEAELEQLATKAARAGYRKGWTDANRQAGRDL